MFHQALALAGILSEAAKNQIDVAVRHKAPIPVPALEELREHGACPGMLNSRPFLNILAAAIAGEDSEMLECIELAACSDEESGW